MSEECVNITALVEYLNEHSYRLDARTSDVTESDGTYFEVRDNGGLRVCSGHSPERLLINLFDVLHPIFKSAIATAELHRENSRESWIAKMRGEQ